MKLLTLYFVTYMYSVSNKQRVIVEWSVLVFNSRSDIM